MCSSRGFPSTTDQASPQRFTARFALLEHWAPQAALNSATPILAATEGAVAASQGESLGDGLVKGGIAAAAALGGARFGGAVRTFFHANGGGKALEIGGALGGEALASMGIQLAGTMAAGQKLSLGDVAATGVSVTSATTLTSIADLGAEHWQWDTGTRLSRTGIGLTIGLLTIGAGQGAKALIDDAAAR